VKFKVHNTKYGDTDIYECKSSDCNECGLRFVCYTGRNEVEINMEAFLDILRGKAPQLLWRSVVKGNAEV
jgi:hypothetical protein